MKKFVLIYIAFFTALSWGCTSKTLDLEVLETACKNFTLSLPSYRFIDYAECGSTDLDRTIEITFQFDGPQDCIHMLDIESGFYDYNNNAVTGITATDSLLVTDPQMEVFGNMVNFKFCYDFSSIDDTTALNYIIIDFHIENELGNESNVLSLRIPRPGAPLNPSFYNIDETIYVQNQYLDVFVWDDAAEDGDIISLNLNNEWVVENHMLTNAGHTIPVQVNVGTNVLVMFAVNLGSSPPNTGAIRVWDGFTTQEVILNSTLTNSGAIEIIYQ